MDRGDGRFPFHPCPYTSDLLTSSTPPPWVADKYLQHACIHSMHACTSCAMHACITYTHAHVDADRTNTNKRQVLLCLSTCFARSQHCNSIAGRCQLSFLQYPAELNYVKFLIKSNGNLTHRDSFIHLYSCYSHFALSQTVLVNSLARLVRCAPYASTS